MRSIILPRRLSRDELFDQTFDEADLKEISSSIAGLGHPLPGNVRHRRRHRRRRRRGESLRADIRRGAQ